MSRSGLLLASVGLLLLGAAGACTPSLDNGTVCGRAAEMLGTCGVLLPFTTDPGSCTGDQEAVARCITSAGGSCDALANLSSHLSDCVDADGGMTFPTSVPGLGLGGLDAGAFTLDGSPGTTVTGGSGGDGDDGGGTPVDAGRGSDADADAAAPVDGGSDASAAPDSGADAATALLDVSDAVVDGETKSYQTVRLGPGSYLFTITGLVGAQLRVRKVEASSTEDCVVNADAAGQSCLDTVTRSAILYADVVGDGSAATFHLVAVTESP